jgi:hypothetical protein
MADEGATVRAFCEKQQQLKVGDAWFLISSKWWADWAGYAGYGGVAKTAGNTRPPQIDNTDLLAEVAMAGLCVLRSGVREYTDYMLVPEQAWDYLRGIYGAAQSLRRLVVDRGGSEMVIEMYPLIITAAKLQDDGSVCPGSEKVETFTRSTKFPAAFRKICESLGFAATATPTVQYNIWGTKGTQAVALADVATPTALRRFQRLVADSDDAIGDLMIPDGGTVLVERCADSGEFAQRVRRSGGSDHWVDPASQTDILDRGHRVDIQVDGRWFSAVVAEVGVDAQARKIRVAYATTVNALPTDFSSKWVDLQVEANVLARWHTYIDTYVVRDPFGPPRDFREDDKCEILIGKKWIAGTVDSVDWREMTVTVTTARNQNSHTYTKDIDSSDLARQGANASAAMATVNDEVTPITVGKCSVDTFSGC